MLQDPLDDIVLVRVGERGDDSHLFTTGVADFRIVLPDLLDEPRPVLTAQPDELVLLLGGDDVGGSVALGAALAVDPAELAANRRGDGAVAENPALVPERNVQQEHGEELEARDELMVAAEARVETGAPVKDAAIIEILEPLERHGGALEVLEQGLELLAVALCQPAIRMDSET